MIYQWKFLYVRDDYFKGFHTQDFRLMIGECAEVMMI